MNLKIFSQKFSFMLITLIVVLPCMLISQSAIEVQGFSANAWGAGAAFTNLDSNPRPELILLVYDVAERPNNFHYRIGWNVDKNGTAEHWGDNVIIPGIGWGSLGAGIAVTQLDNDARPEIILMIYLDYEMKDFRYTIGWNLDANGLTTHWDKEYMNIFGCLGWAGAGGGLAVAQLDDNPRPDLILACYDDPQPGMNYFRYLVGWNLDQNGKAAKWHTYREILGMSNVGGGAGIAVAHLDNKPAPELILMDCGIFDQESFYHYRICRNLNPIAATSDWGDSQKLPGVGPNAAGADIAVFNIDEDARPDFILVANINPFVNSIETGPNKWSYRVVKNIGAAKRMQLEIDKLESVTWPPDQVRRQEATHSLPEIFALAGIQLKTAQNEGNIPDIKKGQPYTDAEIHSFLSSHQNVPIPADTYPMYTAALSRHHEGLPGMMVFFGQRRVTTVFTGEYRDDAQYLRSLAHQVGRALNLQYSDGDAWRK
ncbi:MAG: hypothetical protein MUF15_26915, partial [Acidobacteria bacterium]|nr:hypothetical protein [Acidobacteriota bacterium]